MYFSRFSVHARQSRSVDKCFVPSDVLNEKARSRGLDQSQIVQYGLPIRKGFWSTKSGSAVNSSKSKVGRRKVPFFGRPKHEVEEKSLTSSSTIETVALRERLGLGVGLPTCLVMGGGDGMGGIVDIATALGKRLGDSGHGSSVYQMIVVCGNNQQAQLQLEKVAWGPGVEVHVKGFVNNMDEFMNAADCLVTKAGPGTIAEACICGLPCMLFAYL
jgi:1,2-diacylglycerol 3-beta-galactosyltransferase